ncbi:pseudouridine synthase [Candidatus Vidania fulgoroideorum]
MHNTITITKLQKYNIYKQKQIAFIDIENGTPYLINSTPKINFIRKSKAELIYKTTPYEPRQSLLGKLLKTNLINKKLYRFGILNRIDFQVSGIIILAKTLITLHQIITLHKQQAIKKIYYAYVSGHIAYKQVLYQQLSKYHSKNPKQYPNTQKVFLKIKPLLILHHLQLTLIKCKTYTGKYHQVRKMLYAIGKPIAYNKLNPHKLLLTLYKIKIYTYNPCI